MHYRWERQLPTDDSKKATRCHREKATWPNQQFSFGIEALGAFRLRETGISETWKGWNFATNRRSPQILAFKRYVNLKIIKSQRICFDSCWMCPESVSHAPMRPCIQIGNENITQKGNDSLCVHRTFSYEMFQPLSINESLFGLTFCFPQKFECKVKMQWRGLINNDGNEGR